MHTVVEKKKHEIIQLKFKMGDGKEEIKFSSNYCDEFLSSLVGYEMHFNLMHSDVMIRTKNPTIGS